MIEFRFIPDNTALDPLSDNAVVTVYAGTTPTTTTTITTTTTTTTTTSTTTTTTTITEDGMIISYVVIFMVVIGMAIVFVWFIKGRQGGGMSSY